jgi:hypothetical protein
MLSIEIRPDFALASPSRVAAPSFWQDPVPEVDHPLVNDLPPI